MVSAQAAESTEQEMDESVYDALGLTTDAETTDATKPFGESGTWYAKNELYVKAVGISCPRAKGRPSRTSPQALRRNRLCG